MCVGGSFAGPLVICRGAAALPRDRAAPRVVAPQTPPKRPPLSTQQPQKSRTHLAVEAVHLVHRVRLVVAAAEVHARGLEHLPREQGEDDLDAEGAAVDKVAVEEVGVVGGGQAVHLEDVEQVVVLQTDGRGGVSCVVPCAFVLSIN